MNMDLHYPKLSIVKNTPPSTIKSFETQLPSTSNKYNGIISGPFFEKVSSLDSKYEDTFDWSIYDKIHHRFGTNQPRGGVVFKTTLKLANHHDTCAKCHYAFELDSYGRGCLHDCLYCYAKEQLSAYGYWNRPMPFPVDLSEIRKIFHTVFETEKPHKWRKILLEKIPLRIGSMSDSFLWIDLKYGVTKELLKILKFYKYPYVVFTRSDLVAHDDYISLIASSFGSVQLSISGNNELLTKVIEPGAPSVSRRLAALKKLKEAGIWTAVRVNPLFPTRPDGYNTDLNSVICKFGNEDNIPEFNLYDTTFIEQIAASGTNSLIVGFVRLSPAAVKSISSASNIDLNSFFNETIQNGYSDRRYSDAEIRSYYDSFALECKKYSLRFSTCYIGNGEKDYEQYQALWSNKNDCCDIAGNVDLFDKSSQSIEWVDRLSHAPGHKKKKIMEDNIDRLS